MLKEKEWNGIATLEDSSVISYKAEHIVTIQSKNWIL